MRDVRRGTWFGLCVVGTLALGLACGGGDQPGSDLPNDWEAHKDKAERAAAKAKQAAAKAKEKAKDAKDSKGKGKKGKN